MSIIHAALQCISRRTSYHNVRLAFHSLTQIIKVLCNVHLFGPISLFMSRSRCFGSNLTDLTHLLYRQSLSLRLFTLPVRLSCWPIMQKVRHYNLILCLLVRLLVQALFHQSSTAFNLSLTVLFTIAECIILSLGGWYPHIRTIWFRPTHVKDKQ
jgi:hypothetical protein